MNDTLEQLQTAQQTVEPRFRAHCASASSALKAAAKLASEEKADALPMQKALVKLEQAAEQVSTTKRISPRHRELSRRDGAGPRRVWLSTSPKTSKRVSRPKV